MGGPGAEGGRLRDLVGGCLFHRSNDLFFSNQNWLSPTALYHLKGARLSELQRLPTHFKSRGLVSEQHWAVSADGTRFLLRGAAEEPQV